MAFFCTAAAIQSSGSGRKGSFEVAEHFNHGWRKRSRHTKWLVAYDSGNTTMQWSWVLRLGYHHRSPQKRTMHAQEAWFTTRLKLCKWRQWTLMLPKRLWPWSVPTKFWRHPSRSSALELSLDGHKCAMCNLQTNKQNAGIHHIFEHQV